jgi:hypothetical protein
MLAAATAGLAERDPPHNCCRSKSVVQQNGEGRCYKWILSPLNSTLHKICPALLVQGLLSAGIRNPDNSMWQCSFACVAYRYNRLACLACRVIVSIQLQPVEDLNWLFTSILSKVKLQTTHSTAQHNTAQHSIVLLLALCQLA